MGLYATDTIRRGQSGIAPFAVAFEEDLKVSFKTVADLTERDAIPIWQRLPYMTVRVISEDKEYTLGSDLTLGGQIWTDKTYGLPSNVVTEDEIFDINGYVQPQLIKNIFLNTSYVVASQAAMLALTSLTGNFFIRTDLGQVFIKLNDNNPAILGDFTTSASPGAVLSVNGLTGVVNITIANLLAVPANQTAFDIAVVANTTVAGHSSSITTLTSGLSTTNTNVTNLSTYVQGNIGLQALSAIALSPTGAEIGYSLKWDGTEYTLLPDLGGGGGSSSFIGLVDVPLTYTGQSLKGVRVNTGETGLEFYTVVPFSDANPLIVNQFDPTALVQFDASGVNTASTTFFAFPNAGGTLLTDNSSIPWYTITSKPTTISGYGITDALINGATNSLFADTIFDAPFGNSFRLGYNSTLGNFSSYASNVDIKSLFSTNFGAIGLNSSYTLLQYKPANGTKGGAIRIGQDYNGTGQSISMYATTTGSPSESDLKFRINTTSWTVNLGSDAIGDWYQRDAGSLFSRVASVSAGSFIRSGGVATISAWSTVKLPDTMSALGLWVANSANTTVNLTATALQSIRVNAGGTAWEAYTPSGGGITNSAINTEFMVSNGTNAIGSKLYNPSTGALTFGDVSTSGSKSLSVVSSTGNTNFSINTEGTGVLQLSHSTTSTGVQIIVQGGSGQTAKLSGDGNGGLEIYGYEATAGVGKDLILRGGNSTTGNNNGSDVIIRSGAPFGSGAEAAVKIQSRSTGKLGYFNTTPVVQQSVNTILVNSVTSGGSLSTIANYTDLTIYANDAATIRNNIFRLTEKVLALETALRNYGHVKD